MNKIKPKTPSAGGNSHFSRLEQRTVDGKGRGVFTTTAFRKGEEVMQFLGEIVDRDTLEDLTHALQVGPRLFLTPSGQMDDYVNHSCEPNTGIRDPDGRVVLFALRDIAAGEEITFDYATTQTGGHWTMNCVCGSPHCRRAIGDFEDMDQKRQRELLELGAVLGYLRPPR